MIFGTSREMSNPTNENTVNSDNSSNAPIAILKNQEPPIIFDDFCKVCQKEKPHKSLKSTEVWCSTAPFANFRSPVKMCLSCGKET